jgi:prepilin-type N-terminal cleavage/methylation domain-containing protein
MLIVPFKRRRAGSTLVELLVVIAIIGVRFGELVARQRNLLISSYQFTPSA